METNNTTPPTVPQEKSFGPLVGIVIIIAVLVIGGFYFWGKRLNNPTPQPNQNANQDQIVGQLENVSDSDLVEDIANDLKSTPIDNLDDGADDVNDLINNNQ